MTIIRSLSRDPAWNLFMEQELVEWADELCGLAGGLDGQVRQAVCGRAGQSEFGQARPLLMFYINSPSVIVGRNQSVEAEVDVAWCTSRNIPVLCRASGGGAVWHDEGNINFSFISGGGNAGPEYCRIHGGGNGDRNKSRDIESTTVLDSASSFLNIIISALSGFGIDAVAGPRRELTVGGLKISGTASSQRRGRGLFHGTLLHRADLDAMQKALAGNTAARGRKVASVPGRVMNLATLPGMDMPTEKFLDKFIATLWKQSCDTNARRR